MTWRRWIRGVCVAACGVMLAGCEPDALSHNGVVAVFGGVGRGPAEFSYPRAIAAEPEGSVFVVDKAGRVQRFSAEGVYELEWTMPETAHGKPVGLAVHPDGRLFVADTHYHRVMIFDRDGRPVGHFGEQGRGPGQMELPTAVTFDRKGYIYVSEYQGNDRITKWSPALEYVGAIGETPVEGERLRRPAGIEVDDDGVLWVADACNHRIVAFDESGKAVRVFGRFGKEEGLLDYPYDLSLTPDGQMVMVCEFGSNRLQWFRKDGTFVKSWGRSGREPGCLWAPWGAIYGPGGRVYVVDSINSRIQVVRAE